MIKRDDVIKYLKPLLLENETIYTIWEGGSKATHRLDEYSDLDLMMVTDKANIKSTYDFLENILEKAFGIKQIYQVKEPAWHGFSQRFYQLKQTPKYFYLDVCILHPEINDKFTASDRHGKPFVWKDTIDFIDSSKTPKNQILTKARSIYNHAVKSEFILRNEVTKSLLRENLIDAHLMINTYLLRHVVPLLNIKYRIALADFGLRYASTVYNQADLALIETFIHAQTIRDFTNAFQAFVKRFEHLKDEVMPLIRLD